MAIATAAEASTLRRKRADEGHGGASVEQFDRGPDLFLAHAELGRDPLVDAPGHGHPSYVDGSHRR